jgi:hypothetical protein
MKMELKAAIKKIIVISIAVGSFGKLHAQAIVIDTKELEPLVKEWNFAHNARSTEAFRRIYDNRLLFYTQTLSRQKCLSLKQALFNKQPAFQQRITDLIFTPYTSGVIKCDFKKDVFANHQWKTYSAYLLISYANNHYKIVGEGDYQTDRTLHFSLGIGNPMDIPVASAPQQDSVLSGKHTSDSVMDDDVNRKIFRGIVVDSDVANFQAIATHSLSDNIAIPKMLFYSLIGLLFVTLTLVIKYQYKFESNKNAKLRKPKRHAKDKRIAGERQLFEDFIINFFDPLFFKILSRNNHRDNPEEADFKIEYNHKGVYAKFGFKCFYIPRTDPHNPVVIDLTGLDKFVQNSEQRNLQPYVIIGAGGSWDDPAEIFLIPLQSLKERSFSYQQLLPFKKSGMFYFNVELNKLR